MVFAEIDQVFYNEFNYNKSEPNGKKICQQPKKNLLLI